MFKVLGCFYIWSKIRVMFKKLKELFLPKHSQVKFVCSSCGKEHDNWPALGYDSPASNLNEEERDKIEMLTSDCCVIKYDDQTDRFIRGVLKIPVNNSCQDLEYGIWVSLSEKSFDDYQANYNNNNSEGGYFGWIFNDIEGYSGTLLVPSDVCLQLDGLRPLIVPHQSCEHPLVYDYYNGISIAEAENRINAVIQKSGN